MQASRTSNDGEDDFDLGSRAQDGHFTAKDVGALTKLMPDPKEDDIVDTGPGQTQYPAYIVATEP